MAVYDLYNWTPAITVGGTSPDNYNIPGATALDGSISAGEAPAINAGTAVTATVSPLVIPSYAEIDDSSDLNQINAALNQRFLQIYEASLSEAVHATPTMSANRTQGAIIPRVGAQTPQIQGSITNLRLAEGNIYAYSFTSIAAGDIITGKLFSQMRQALAIGGDGTDVLHITNAPLSSASAYPTYSGTRVNGGYSNYYTDNVGGAGVTRLTVATWADLVNKVGSLSAGGGRWRFRLNIAVPAWLTSCATFSIQLPYGSVTNTNGYTGELWQGATAGTLTTLLTNYTPVASTTDVIALSTSTLTSAAGGMLYLTLTTDLERTGVSTGNNNFFYLTQANTVPVALIVTF